MRRGRATAVVAVLILGLVGPVHGLAQAEVREAPAFSYSGPVPLPEHGALFGVFLRLDEHNGFDRQTAMTNFEALVGRSMAVERVYNLWEDPFPTADDLWSRDQGRTLYLSWNASPRDGSGCKPWADIASGVYDAEIDARAEAIKSFGAPLFFSFHHEPTTKPDFGGSCGDGEDYKAAWTRIRERFDSAGVTNATYSLTMTALSFDRGRGDEFYAGDDVIDVIAADGYNWYSCEFHPGPWREMDEIFDSFYEYGVLKGKPMFIAEYGSGEDDADPEAKARWWANGADILKQWPEIKGVAYFNVGTGGACDRYVDSSTNSLDSFQAMGADTYFNPPPTERGVSVADFAFSPKNVTIRQGGAVEWSFNGPSAHTATDASTMALFNSGSRATGSTYRFHFIGAGTYNYKCTIHPTMTGRVRVPATAVPSSGGVATEFTITWGAEWAPSDFAFDIQVKRPGAPWTNWLTLQATNSATFVPDAGVGTYSFRARYHNTLTDGRSLYSAPVSIVVS